MSDQFPRKLIELDREMRVFGFSLWGDSWKCDKCTFRAEHTAEAEEHEKTHKKLEEFGIQI